MKTNQSLIALLAILVLVLAGIGYLFSINTLVSPIKFEKEITKVEKTSESNEITDIEDDLDTTDFDNLDTELAKIETELN